MNAKPSLALSIAGFDPSGGAGVIEDLKVFTELGVHGLAVITTLTVQSSFGMRKAQAVDPELITEQLDLLLADRVPGAAKIGMVSTQNIPAILEFLDKVSFPVVADTLFSTGSGFELADKDTIDTFREKLLPKVDLITPNTEEAGRLLRREIKDSRFLEAGAQGLLDLGAKAVLLKGRHLDEDPVIDIFKTKNSTRRFVKPRRKFQRVHGTGCALSSAITAYLARGKDLADAVSSAQAYIDRKLANLLYAGEGAPIINHLR